jgi:hypothetical protein
MKLQIKRTFKLQNIPLPTRKMRLANDIFGSVWWDEYLWTWLNFLKNYWVIRKVSTCSACFVLKFPYFQTVLWWWTMVQAVYNTWYCSSLFSGCYMPVRPKASRFFWFLGAFAKLRKTTLASPCLLVRLSAWDNAAPIGRIFLKFGICYFSKIYGENLSD